MNVLDEFLVALGFKVDETSLKKFTTAVSNVEKAVFRLGAAVTGAAAAVVAGVTVVSHQMEDLYYASQRTGATVENLLALRYAAGQIGVGAGQAQAALESFTRTLRLNPGTGALLKQLGVGGNDPTEVFENFIAKLKGMQPYIAAQYAQLFGIDPDTLLMLENGLGTLEEEQQKYRARLKAFRLNPAQAAQAGKDFNNEIRNLTTDFDLLWVVIESKLNPVLIPLIDRFEQWAETHADQFAQSVADAVEKLASWIQSVNWEKVGDDILSVYEALGGVNGILIGLLAINLAPLVGSVLGLAGALAGLGTVAGGAGLAGLVALLGSLGAAAAAVIAAYEVIKTMKDSGHPTSEHHYIGKHGRIADGPDRKPAEKPQSFADWVKNFFSPGGGHFVSRADRNAHGFSSGTQYDDNGNVVYPDGAKPPTGGDTPTSADTRGAQHRQDSPTKLFSALEQQFGLPAGTLDKVWDVESSRGKQMLSPAGAEGHFQFMRDTANQYGVKDPFDLSQSATGAAKYLHDLLSRYAGDMRKALAAYNWGPGKLDKDLSANGAMWENFLPAETSEYLRKFDSTSRSFNSNMFGGAPLGGNQPRAGTNLTIESKTDIHISPGPTARETAIAVSNEQRRVNGDLVRNFAGAVT